MKLGFTAQLRVYRVEQIAVTYFMQFEFEGLVRLWIIKSDHFVEIFMLMEKEIN